MKQPILGSYNGNMGVDSATPQYNQLMGAQAWSSTENTRCEVIPTAGKLRKLYVRLSADPSNGGSGYTFAVMVNGVASALTVTINAGSTTGNDVANELTLAAGDVVSLRVIASATDPVAVTAAWATEFESNTAGESIVMGSALANSGTARYPSFAGGALNLVESWANNIMPTAGTFKNLYVALSASPGTSPDDYKISLRVGAATKNNTVTVTAPNTTGNDTAHTDAVSAGNYVNLLITPENTPSASPYVAWGIVFVATIDGESLIFGGSNDPNTNSQTEYNHIGSMNDELWITTEAQMASIFPNAFTLKKLYTRLTSTPGTSKHQVLSINSPVGTPTGITIDITGTGSYGNDSINTFDTTPGDTVTMVITPSGGPTASSFRYGMVAYIAPTATSVTWKGRVWTLRNGGTGEPGFGGWSGNNVTGPDGNDYLTLKITNPTAAAPIGCEMTCNTVGLGYGTYKLVLGSNLHALDKNIVFGNMFPFLYSNPYLEIDCGEISAWDTANSPTVSFSNYAGGDPDYPLETYSAAQEAPNETPTTFRMIWMPGKITYDVFSGVGYGGTLLFHGETIKDVPVPSTEALLINLWAFANGTPGADDIDAAATDVILRDFSFTALAEPDTKTYELRVTKSGTPIDSYLYYPAMVVSAVQNLTKTLTENIITAMAINNMAARTFSQTMAIVGGITNGSIKILSQTLTVVDSVLKTAGRTLSQNIIKVDGFASSLSAYRTLSENVVVASSVIKSAARNLLENIVTADILVKAIAGVKTLSENLTVAMTVDLSKVVTTALSEILSVVDWAWNDDECDSFAFANKNEAHAFLYQAPPGVEGQTFTGNGEVLRKIALDMSRTGSTAGQPNLYIDIYAHTGTYGTSGLPNGAVLATSDPVSFATLQDNYFGLKKQDFTFSGANKITLANGTYYCFVVKPAAFTGGANPFIARNTGGGAAGNSFYYPLNVWTVQPGDFCFYIYTDGKIWRPIFDITRAISENAIVGSVFSTGSTIYKILSENLAIVASNIMAMARNLLENIIIAPVQATALSASRLFSETMIIAGNIANATGRTLSQNVVVATAISTAATLAKILSQTLTVADSLLKSAARTISENVIVGTSLSALKLTLKTIAETVVIAGNIASWVINKVIIETITIIVTGVFGGQNLITLTETIRTVEIFSKTAMKICKDAVAIATVFAFGSISKLFVESISITTSFVRNLISKVLVETVNIGGSFLVFVSMTINEIVILVGNYSRQSAKMFIEAVSVTSNAISIFAKVLLETVRIAWGKIRLLLNGIQVGLWAKIARNTGEWTKIERISGSWSKIARIVSGSWRKISRNDN